MIYTHNGLDWHQVINTFLFIPVFDFVHYTNPSHPYGWTLSFEMTFYLLLFVGLKVAKCNASDFVLLFLVFGFLFAFVFPFTVENIYIFKFIFHPFVLEFVFGMLIFRFVRYFNKFSFIFSLCSSFILLFFVVKFERLGWHDEVLASYAIGLERTFLWGGLGASLTIVAISLDNMKNILYPRFLLKLGDGSYSMYLIQPYCVMLSNKFFKIGFSGFFSAVFYVLSVIALGLFISNKVEFKLNDVCKRFLYSLFLKKDEM